MAFLLTSLGESLCDDRERELSLWDRSDRSERSDFGDGDFARLLPLLRDGLGEALCRLFLCKESKYSYVHAEVKMTIKKTELKSSGILITEKSSSVCAPDLWLKKIKACDSSLFIAV